MSRLAGIKPAVSPRLATPIRTVLELPLLDLEIFETSLLDVQHVVSQLNFAESNIVHEAR